MRLLQLNDDGGRRGVARVGDARARLEVLADYGGGLGVARGGLRRGVELARDPGDRQPRDPLPRRHRRSAARPATAEGHVLGAFQDGQIGVGR